MYEFIHASMCGCLCLVAEMVAEMAWSCSDDGCGASSTLPSCPSSRKLKQRHESLGSESYAFCVICELPNFQFLMNVSSGILILKFIVFL